MANVLRHDLQACVQRVAYQPVCLWVAGRAWLLALFQEGWQRPARGLRLCVSVVVSLLFVSPLPLPSLTPADNQHVNPVHVLLLSLSLSLLLLTTRCWIDVPRTRSAGGPRTMPLEQRDIADVTARQLQRIVDQLDVITQTVSILEERLSLVEHAVHPPQRPMPPVGWCCLPRCGLRCSFLDAVASEPLPARPILVCCRCVRDGIEASMSIFLAISAMQSVGPPHSPSPSSTHRPTLGHKLILLQLSGGLSCARQWSADLSTTRASIAGQCTHTTRRRRSQLIRLTGLG